MRWVFLAGIGIGASACSSSPKSASKSGASSANSASAAASAPGVGWDYDKIKETRRAETQDAVAAQSPARLAEIAAQREADANCVIMTSAEKLRARPGPCRRLDARAGHGDDAWCCAPTN